MPAKRSTKGSAVKRLAYSKNPLQGFLAYLVLGGIVYALIYFFLM